MQIKAFENKHVFAYDIFIKQSEINDLQKFDLSLQE